MWTVEIIKARFIEAADIERRMLVKGMSAGGNAWPTYRFDDDDREGWDEQSKQDEVDALRRRLPLGTPELTRWEEVFFDWTALVPQARRILVWRWSQCIASGRSFSEWCERKGLVRMTAYNRMEKVFAALAAQFDLEARLLRQPAEKFALQTSPEKAPSVHTMGERAPKRRYAETHPTAYQVEPSTDQLTTPEAIEAFAQHLADVNEERRKARMRKALRGVPGEQEAA